MTGPATRADLEELHRLVVRSLIDRIATAPSAELLQAARGVLKDAAVTGMDFDQAEAARLRKLWHAYVQRLEDALRMESPQSSPLAEARQFLQQQGLSVDLGAALDQAAAVAVLSDLDLPFAS